MGETVEIETTGVPAECGPDCYFVLHNTPHEHGVNVKGEPCVRWRGEVLQTTPSFRGWVSFKEDA